MTYVSDVHHGVNIEALMRALPISGLEPQCIAYIGGLIDVPQDQRWRETISLLEPPAGQRVPYIDPENVIEKLLRHQGVKTDDAQMRARKAVVQIRGDVADDHWVNFYHFGEHESPACLSVPDFVEWVRKERDRIIQLAVEFSNSTNSPNVLANEHLLVPTEIIDFIAQAAEVTTKTPMFHGPDNWNEPWSLENLPSFPPPKAMIEFVPGAPWNEIDDWDKCEVDDNPFLCWREAIRPVAQALENALGQSVYHFAVVDDDVDDDSVHRFLVLHWCCTHKPESAFVQYLLKISGAKDLQLLKSALIDPSSYTHPFKMYESFFGIEVSHIGRFDYQTSVPSRMVSGAG